MAIKGFPIATIINGKVVMADGKVLKEGSGQPLEF
jgi:dihydroorotase-like cyclic amidohydrolase